MKVARRVVLFLMSALAVLSLSGCKNLPCTGMTPGSTGGSGSGSSGGTVTTDTCNGSGVVGGIGVGSALIYTVNGSSAQAATLNGNTLGLVSPYTPPTLVGSGADDMLIVNKKFLYIPQGSSLMVEGFVISRSTGALTPIPGSPFSVASGSDTIASDPQGRFLFLGNEGSGQIATFMIDANTGALTQSPGSPFTYGLSSADTFAVDGNGKFLYVGQMSTTLPLHIFAIDQNTGAIAPIPGSPFPLGISTPHADPSGKFMLGIAGFVDEGGASGDTHIHVFAIDPVTGALSPVPGSPFATASSPEEFAISPNGSFVYSFGFTSSATNAPIEGFQMDPTTGALTSLQGSPFVSLPAPAQCKFDQSGGEMFCTDSIFGSKLMVFTTNSTNGAVSHNAQDLVTSSFPLAVTN